MFLELGPKYLISKSNCSIEVASNSVMVCLKIRVKTKLPNSEQSSKGKVKTQVYTDKIRQQPENCENRNETDFPRVSVLVGRRMNLIWNG